MKISFLRPFGLLLFLLVSLASTAAELKVGDLISLLQKEIPDLKKEELERMAAIGLARELSPRVLLETAAARGAEKGVLGSAKYFGRFIVVRVDSVRTGVENEIQEAVKKEAGKDPITGIVLDLRFARGTDYAAAAALADRFIGEKISLIDWGTGPYASTSKTEFLNMPLVVLVNRETRGAAEALAAMLRHARSALVVGGETAGQVRQMREIPLADSSRLLIAGAPVKLEGAEISKIEPDIAVFAPLEQEKIWVQDPYKNFDAPVPSTRNLRSLPRRTNEAELVRQHREGLHPEESAAASPAEAAAGPQLRDPSLVRGLDLLRGLSLLSPKAKP